MSGRQAASTSISMQWFRSSYVCCSDIYSTKLLGYFYHREPTKQASDVDNIIYLYVPTRHSSLRGPGLSSSAFLFYTLSYPHRMSLCCGIASLNTIHHHHQVLCLLQVFVVVDRLFVTTMFVPDSLLGGVVWRIVVNGLASRFDDGFLFILAVAVF